MTTKADEMPDAYWAKFDDGSGEIFIDKYQAESYAEHSFSKCQVIPVYTRQQEQADGGDYTAWLVEQEEKGETLYLQFKDRIYNFTRNADEALHFTRKEDAEDMAKLNSNLKAVEHMWPKPSKPSPVAAPETDGRQHIHITELSDEDMTLIQNAEIGDGPETDAGKALDEMPEPHEWREEWNIEKVDSLVQWYQANFDTIRAALKKNVGEWKLPGVVNAVVEAAMKKLANGEVLESDQRIFVSRIVRTYLNRTYAPQGGDTDGGE